MQIIFDSDSVSFDLIESDLSSIYQRSIFHLRHVDIPFCSWDNPYSTKDYVKCLVDFGKTVNVEVDGSRCRDQEYLNFLHTMYEQNYPIDLNPDWLNFHEHIHLCEFSGPERSTFIVDFREKAGPLEKPFDLRWLEKSTLKLNAGDIFVKWSELGKIPHTYWKNQEPNDINRIKELCKPWLTLRPKIYVALVDIDYEIESRDFDRWWSQYHDEWCNHWRIPKWDLKDMRCALVVGCVPLDQLEKLKIFLKQGHAPRRIGF